MAAKAEAERIAAEKEEKRRKKQEKMERQKKEGTIETDWIGTARAGTD